MRLSPAYTLIEVLVVISLVGIISTAGFASISSTRNNQLVRQNAELVSDTMRRASLYSQNARNERTWGVKSDDQKKYSIVSKSTDEDISIESTSSLSEDLTFSSPFLLWFTKGSGKLSADTVVEVTSPQHKTSTITITTIGTIDATGP